MKRFVLAFLGLVLGTATSLAEDVLFVNDARLDFATSQTGSGWETDMSDPTNRYVYLTEEGRFELRGTAENVSIVALTNLTVVCKDLQLTSFVPELPPLAIGTEDQPVAVELLVSGWNLVKHPVEEDDLYFSPTAAIHVPSGSSLTIDSLEGDAEAHLSAIGGVGGAGIGGGNECQWEDMPSGAITICGGYIDAEGGEGAAGLGAGAGLNWAGYEITINGGTVVAKGGDGVWGGVSASLWMETYGLVKVNGGSVVANIEDNPCNDRNAPVWCLEVPVEGAKNGERVVVSGFDGRYGLKDCRVIDIADGQGGRLCFWLPDGEYFFKVEGLPKQGLLARAPAVARPAAGIRINGADLTRKEGEGWSYDESAKFLSISGPGTYLLTGENMTDGIRVVQETGAQVVFSNLMMTVSQPYAFADSAGLGSTRISLVGENVLRGWTDGSPALVVARDLALVVAAEEGSASTAAILQMSVAPGNDGVVIDGESSTSELAIESGTIDILQANGEVAGIGVAHRIEGGSVHATSDMARGTSGTPVQCVAVNAVGLDLPLAITGLPEGYDLSGVVPVNGCLYFWLPEGVYDLSVNGRRFRAKVEGTPVEADPVLIGVTVNGDDIWLTANEGWTFDGSVLTLDGSLPYTVSGANGANPLAIVVSAPTTVHPMGLTLTDVPVTVADGAVLTFAGGEGESGEVSTLDVAWTVDGTVRFTGGTIELRREIPAAVVTGGSLKATIGSAVNGAGRPVRCVAVETSDDEVTVAGLPEDYAVGGLRPIDGKLYLWLPDGGYSFAIGGEPWYAVVSRTSVEAGRAAWDLGAGLQAGLSLGTLTIAGAGDLADVKEFPWEGLPVEAIVLGPEVEPSRDLVKDCGPEVTVNGLALGMIHAYAAALEPRADPDDKGFVSIVDGHVRVTVRLEAKEALEDEVWQPVTDYEGSAPSGEGDAVILDVPAEKSRGFFRLAE